MPRIIVNPGSPAAWEIQLKPGTNRFGRASTSDFPITDPSVSGTHCEIQVEGPQAVIKDLGSTNGTFINRAPVKEAMLKAGQTIHLGNVELLFCADVAPAAAVIRAVPVGVPAAAPGGAAVRVVSSPSVMAASAPPVIPAAMPAVQGDGHCKFHPKTAARYLCQQCHQSFCELCVTTRDVGGRPAKFCRHCGVACVPLQVRAQVSHGEGPGFFASLPGAFVYPFRGSGVFVLLFATVLIAGATWLAGGSPVSGLRVFRFGMLMSVVAYGYLFTYLQSILHSTGVGDTEMPSLPGLGDFWQDLLLPCLQLLGLCLLCFGPALILAIVQASSEESSIGGTPILIAFALGCAYFPMAFLSVAMLDSVFAANPLQVIPSIAKVPLEYLTTLVLVAVILGIQWLGDTLLDGMFPKGLGTHNLNKLFGYIGLNAVWKIGGIYLLTVNARLLGLLYVTRKEKLGWFSH